MRCRCCHKLNGGSLREFKFFSVGETTIAGRTLRALRHGMGGAPGLEFWGQAEAGAEIQPHRRKVTLLWNPQDVLGVSASWLSDEPNGKFMEMPTAHYATHPLEKCWLPLTILSEEAPLGSDVTLVRGEPDGGSKKPVVERRAQRQIRAAVHPWPYARQARQGYRPPGGAVK